MINFNIKVTDNGKFGDPWSHYKDIPCRAVIAVNEDGDGCVLWAVGRDLDFEMNEMGNASPEDLGILPKNNSVGIFIWEGNYVWSGGTYEHPLDGDYDPVGKHRSPTQEEWQMIIQGKCPWNPLDWVKEECKEAFAEQ